MREYASKRRMQKRGEAERQKREVSRIEGGIGSRVSDKRKMHIYTCDD